MRAANVWNLGVKELRSLASDPILLFLIAYAFTFAIYWAATAAPETLHKVPIAIVDEDRSQLSTQIISAFYPPYFMPPRLIPVAEMDARMDAGLDSFSLDIPPEFQRDLLAGRPATIQLNVDATRMSQAFTGTRSIQMIVTDEVRAFLQRARDVAVPPVDLALRVRFNPELNKSWFGAIMEIINNLTMLSIVLTGAAIIREREHGTIEHLLVMPVTPFEIMTGKVWAVGLVVLGAAAVSLVAVVHGWLAVPIQGSLALFLAGAALDLFATATMGIFLATLVRSMPQFALLLMLVLLPLEMLSGALTPRENMPMLVQHVMSLAPNTHFVTLAQAILYRGAGLEVVWPQFVAMAMIGGVLFALALFRFRKSITAMS